MNGDFLAGLRRPAARWGASACAAPFGRGASAFHCRSRVGLALGERRPTVAETPSVGEPSRPRLSEAQARCGGVCTETRMRPRRRRRFSNCNYGLGAR